jgi:ABC-type transport system involved in cytochrome c biogenesis permease subunit
MSAPQLEQFSALRAAKRLAASFEFERESRRTRGFNHSIRGDALCDYLQLPHGEIARGAASVEKLDSLMYVTAGVTFAGLALLLMTGAIWANESWGITAVGLEGNGAFVAWLTYAAFLHSRIARWSGRRSAYFAVAGFLFVIFTYLGVSYLLPGLHSYA